MKARLVQPTQGIRVVKARLTRQRLTLVNLSLADQPVDQQLQELEPDWDERFQSVQEDRLSCYGW